MYVGNSPTPHSVMRSTTEVSRYRLKAARFGSMPRSMVAGGLLQLIITVFVLTTYSSVLACQAYTTWSLLRTAIWLGLFTSQTARWAIFVTSSTTEPSKADTWRFLQRRSALSAIYDLKGTIAVYDRMLLGGLALIALCGVLEWCAVVPYLMSKTPLYTLEVANPFCSESRLYQHVGLLAAFCILAACHVRERRIFANMLAHEQDLVREEQVSDDVEQV